MTTRNPIITTGNSIMTIERFLTIQQVAESLAVSLTTVRKLIRQRRLASLKIGRAVRVRESAVQTYVQTFERRAITPGTFRK